MLRAILPVGILMFAGVSLEPAEAANCPAGQFYRVSLKVCQPRASALKQIRGEKPAAAQKVAKTEPGSSFEMSAKPSPNVRSAKVMLPPPCPNDLADNEVETTRGYSPDPSDAGLRGIEAVKGKPNSLPPATTSFSPYGALSPFGATR